MGNDLKGAENRAGYFVLRMVSKNLPLLISPQPKLAVCPMLSAPASSSAPATSQDYPWARAGEVGEQGGGQAEEGATFRVRGPAGCLGI